MDMKAIQMDLKNCGFIQKPNNKWVKDINTNLGIPSTQAMYIDFNSKYQYSSVRRLKWYLMINYTIEQDNNNYSILLPHAISFTDLESVVNDISNKYNIPKSDIFINEINHYEGDIELLFEKE